MRDGVRLRAGHSPTLRCWPLPDACLPDAVRQAPALEEYTTFAHAVERGYAVVVQDVRGRYASDGEFRPYENEGRDGYDTIEWAARQPWSNGRVGTFGLSYPGAVQWLAAVESPPHLEAMVPAMTFSTPQNFFYSGGVWDLSWTQWIWQSIARRCARQAPPVGRRRSGQRAAMERRQVDDARHTAARSASKRCARSRPTTTTGSIIRRRIRSGTSPSCATSTAARAPPFSICPGWNDDNYGPEGAITNYLGLVAARGAASPRTALLLGPWVHGVDATARTKFGDRDFGHAAAIDYDDVVLSWMDRYLRDDRRGATFDGVRYFVMGANHWTTSETLASSGPRPRVLLVRSPNAAGARHARADRADCFERI